MNDTPATRRSIAKTALIGYAADRLGALEAENAELRALLREVYECGHVGDGPEVEDALHGRIAAALGEIAMTEPTPAQTQREHDADELVTEEMTDKAAAKLFVLGWNVSDAGVRAALRAVAPLIAARALERWEKASAEGMRRADAMARQEEREACAKTADEYAAKSVFGYATIIAAAIRARGETPTKAPGEIDWSAMDKD
jgi:hypothetical protein